jgi:hypothetical protein
MKTKNLFYVVGWLFLLSTISLTAYGQKKGCGESCFHSEILEMQPNDGCTSYTVKVTADSDCVHGLSHYSVGIPECLEISQVSNSEGWKIEYGTDPTTGISGFKVDDINGCGEDKLSSEFIVSFTVCSSGCEEPLTCWSPQVAYKAGTCVYYETTEITCANLDAYLLTTNATCANEASGSAEVVVVDGVAPYAYLWSNGDTLATATNLVAGSYSVIITDASGATLELFNEVTAPIGMSITTEITDASCSGQSDGAITASITGGVPPYNTLWSNGATTENIDGLKGGYYLLTVTDASGCTAKASAIVDNTIFISINGKVTNASCTTDDGAIDVTVEGGTGPYTYSWTNGSEVEDLDGLSTGSYRITATDVNGCFAARTFSINKDNPLRLSSITTPTACVENNSGAIDLFVNGGAEPYTYEWSNGATTQDVDSLSSGAYTVKVTDQNGCFSSLSINIATATFQANSIVNQISCANAADGSISLIINGGTAPYNYVWSNGESGIAVEGLVPGQYSVVISDAAGCTKTLSYTIIEPVPMLLTFAVTNASCGTSDYQIDLSVVGGAGSYTIEWDNGETSEDLVNVIAGTYGIIVTDGKGCMAMGQIMVTPESVNCTDDGGDDGSGDDGNDDGDEDNGSDDGDSDEYGDDHNDGNHANKITICHIPPGNPDNPQTISISESAWAAHEAHGDARGTCNGNDEDEDEEDDNGENDHSKITICHIPPGNPDNPQTISISESAWAAHEAHGDARGTCNGNDEDEDEEDEEDDNGENDHSKITICHIPPGNPDNPQTISISESAWAAHEAHGDSRGTCTENSDDQICVTAYPNPFSGSAKIRVYVPITTNVVVDIINRQGVMIRRIFEGQVAGQQNVEVVFDAHDLPSDIYTYKITTDHKVKYGKMVLAKHL